MDSAISAVEDGGGARAVAKPRVLFVYYSYTQQTHRVAEAMADVMRDQGCEVYLAPIELTDSGYAKRFSAFPLRHVYRDLFGMIPAQLRGATTEIRVPEAAQEGDYDLVCLADLVAEGLCADPLLP